MIDEIAKAEVAVNVHFIPMPMLSFFKSLEAVLKIRYPTFKLRPLVDYEVDRSKV